VVDTGNNRIQIFTTEGDYLTSFSSPGGKVGDLNMPYDIAISSLGKIIVSDNQNKRLLFYQIK
jgi:tripartite motif-containing protein 71